MFNFFNTKDKESISIVKKMYTNMNPSGRNKIFYGGYKKAHTILKNISEIIQKEGNYNLEENLAICRDVYLQVWIRKHGGLAPEFSETQYIKEMLIQRFSFINKNILLNMIDVCVQIIYTEEPDIQKRDALIELRKTIHLGNAEKNKDIEIQHMNDIDYGLVLNKPVFVNGFGSDKTFFDSILTDSGEEITYQRLGSSNVDKINGPVDIYSISKTDGTKYGLLYVCNYGSTMPTNTPKGYMFKSDRNIEKSQLTATTHSLEQEFIKVYNQTQSPPLGAQENAWNWAKEKVLYFKEKNLEKEKIIKLEINMIINLTNAYVKFFDEFLELAGDQTTIIIACESLLSNGNAEKAKEIANPYLKYLDNHPQKYNLNHKCFQDLVERTIFWESNRQYDSLGEFISAPSIEETEDNYTYFLLLYCRIVDSIMIQTLNEMDERIELKKKLLKIASSLSPCNSAVWLEISKTISEDDEEQYSDVIRKALEYSYKTEGHYGIGEIYANMAVHYSISNPELANALCLISKKYGGNPMAAQFILSKTPVFPIDEQTAINTLKNAEIQVGLSSIAQIAIARDLPLEVLI